MTDMITYIIKRNGEKKPFDTERIYKAVKKAFESESINDHDTILSITNSAVNSMKLLNTGRSQDVTVEEVQDVVEKS